MLLRRVLCAAALAACASACDHPTGALREGEARDGDRAAADADAAAPAADAADGGPAPAPFAADDRMELRLAARLAPGEERYQCARIPWRRDGGIAVRRVAARSDAAVHHVNVYWESAPSADFDPASGCPHTRDWRPLYVTGVGTGPLVFPPGTALPIPDGRALALEVHFVNARGAPADATSVVDLELAPRGAAFLPVGVVTVGSTRLELAPRARTTVRATCARHPELPNVFVAFPHMHARGVAIEVVAGSEAPEALVSVAPWNADDQPLLALDPPRHVRADDGIFTACTYDNRSDATVRFGAGSGDEMCFTTLYYWPAEAGAAIYCED